MPSPAPESGPPVVAAPAGRKSWLVSAFVLGFLLYQLITPLRYYLGGGGSDERFSWRMFSSVHMRECQVSLYETVEREGRQLERFVPLESILQAVWIKRLRRDQPAVTENFLHWRCRQPGVTQLRYEMRCTTPDGTQLPVKRLIVDCRSHRVRSIEPNP